MLRHLIETDCVDYRQAARSRSGYFVEYFVARELVRFVRAIVNMPCTKLHQWKR
jgi:hypothetical protein